MHLLLGVQSVGAQVVLQLAPNHRHIRGRLHSLRPNSSGLLGSLLERPEPIRCMLQLLLVCTGTMAAGHTGATAA